MKLKIIGSGGCVSIPRPCCSCKVCVEARKKGFPYARCGCSLYIEDENILIDTPEDINYALNNASVNNVDSILWSHTDPDHIMGIRVLEQLRMDWLGYSVGKSNENPVEIISLPEIIEELHELKTDKGSMLDYYKYRGLVQIIGTGYIEKEKLTINLIPVGAGKNVAIFVIRQNDKKVIYAPCDVKPFPDNPIFKNADLLIIGNTIIGDVLKEGFVLKADNQLTKELFVMDEIIELKERYNIPKIIITHLEEDWGKSYDDYRELEKTFNGIYFAYDGMEICM